MYFVDWSIEIMADQSKKQPRHFSKSTEITVRTRSTSTTTEKFTPFNQKSTLSNNNNGKPHVSKSQQKKINTNGSSIG
jgi:hypothetical protein